MEITTATKTIKFRGLNAYLPVLILRQPGNEQNITIKSVYISTGDPLVNKRDALKYADIWRKESIECGYITHN